MSHTSICPTLSSPSSGPSPSAVLEASTIETSTDSDHSALVVVPFPEVQSSGFGAMDPTSTDEGANISNSTMSNSSPTSSTSSVYFSANSRPATPENDTGAPSDIHSSYPTPGQRLPPRPVFSSSPPGSPLPPPYHLSSPGNPPANQDNDQLGSWLQSSQPSQGSSNDGDQLPSYPPGTCFSVEIGCRVGVYSDW